MFPLGGCGVVAEPARRNTQPGLHPPHPLQKTLFRGCLRAGHFFESSEQGPGDDTDRETAEKQKEQPKWRRGSRALQLAPCFSGMFPRRCLFSHEAMWYVCKVPIPHSQPRPAGEQATQKQSLWDDVWTAVMKAQSPQLERFMLHVVTQLRLLRALISWSLRQRA